MDGDNPFADLVPLDNRVLNLRVLADNDGPENAEHGSPNVYWGGLIIATIRQSAL
jgi:hypothetical protein